MLGNNIKEIRMKNQMTQKELAEAIGVKPQTISSWEVNRTEPNMEALEALAANLNCRKSELIGERADRIQMNLSSEETELIKAFRRMSKPEQAIILRSVGIEPKKENSKSTPA